MGSNFNSGKFSFELLFIWFSKLLLIMFMLSLSKGIASSDLRNFWWNESYFIDVPFVKQEKNFCGAASLAMVFKYWGKNISQYSIAERIYDKSRKGIESEALKSFSEENGFLAFVYKGELENIKDNISKGRPLIVAVSSKTSSGFHYIVFVGFDENQSLVLVNDPYSIKFKEMQIKDFVQRWKKSNYWTLLVIPHSEGLETKR